MSAASGSVLNNAMMQCVMNAVNANDHCVMSIILSVLQMMYY